MTLGGLPSNGAMRRYSWLLVAIGVVTFADGAAEFTGRRYLAKRDQWQLREVEQERVRLQAYRRVAPTEIVVDQDAAVWYRLSLARSALQSRDRRQEVARGTAMPQPGDESSLAQLISGPCREVQSARMREALRSSRCDWESTSIAADPPDAVQALLLGNCLVVDGHLHAVRRQCADAVDAYFRALSFSADLGQADFSMNLGGMAVAREALESIAALTRTCTMSSAFWAHVANELAPFEAVLPSTDAGIRLDRLRVADNVQIDARMYVRRVLPGLRWMVPATAVAAWRVSRTEHLLDLLQQTSDARDQKDRERLAADVDNFVRVSRSDSIRESVPENLAAVVKGEILLVQIYRSIRAAIDVQQRRLAEGRFPADAGPLTSYLESKGLHYESLEEGADYRISVEREQGDLSVIVTGRSQRPIPQPSSPKQP